MEIKGLTIAYSKSKTKARRKRELDLQTRLKELEKWIFYMTNAKLINDALNEKEILKQLIIFYEEKAKGLMLRSKSRWKERDEKPTKYIFKLEMKNYNRKY